MKQPLLLIVSISALVASISPSTAFSKTISSAPAEMIKMSEDEQFAIKEAFINRDWQSVQMIASKSGTFAVYDARKIQDFLSQYDQCRRQPENPLSCYLKARDKWNNLPGTTVLGIPTADFLNRLNPIFIDDYTQAVQDQNQQKKEEGKKDRMEKEPLEEERRKKSASEEAERFRHRREEEHAPKAPEGQEQIDAAPCLKVEGQTAEEMKIVNKVEDGEQFNSLVINYLIMKVKQKPPPSECDLPDAVQAGKSPANHRGKPVRSYGKLIALQVEKRDLAGSNESVSSGMIQRENGVTYFFSPGRAPGFHQGDDVFIEGYFAQNYSYQNKTGDQVTAPVVIGRLKK